MGKVQALAGDWAVGGAGAGWAGTAPGRVQRGIVCVLAVEQRFLIRRVFLVMMQVVLSVGQK
jgi:hypothetical protein